MSHDIAGQLTPGSGRSCARRASPKTVSIAESPALGKDIFSHAHDSRGRRTTRAAGGAAVSGFLEALETPALPLFADQGTISSSSCRPGYCKREQARLHHRGCHDPAFQDLAVQVHLRSFLSASASSRP